MKDPDKRPLEDEAKVRKEWRGEDKAVHGGGGTHLPASETDARASPDGADEDGGGDRRPSGLGAALRPPS